VLHWQEPLAVIMKQAQRFGQALMLAFAPFAAAAAAVDIIACCMCDAQAPWAVPQ
jgi:hypothetical protein